MSLVADPRAYQPETLNAVPDNYGAKGRNWCHLI